MEEGDATMVHTAARGCERAHSTRGFPRQQSGALISVWWRIDELQEKTGGGKSER
jgi:hypothetical protein